MGEIKKRSVNSATKIEPRRETLRKMNATK